MKYWNLKKINQLTLDKTGIIPRSISRIIERFKKELNPNSEVEAVEEFKIADSYFDSIYYNIINYAYNN